MYGAECEYHKDPTSFEADLKLKSGNVLPKLGIGGFQRVKYFVMKSAIYMHT